MGACQQTLGFMLVAAPRKIAFHHNSLAFGRDSIGALIAAGEGFQQEAGPPAPGTYRYHFMGDETQRPRGEPLRRPAPRPDPRPVVPDDAMALATLRLLSCGHVHDMSRLPAAAWSEPAVHVAAGGATVLQA